MPTITFQLHKLRAICLSFCTDKRATSITSTFLAKAKLLLECQLSRSLNNRTSSRSFCQWISHPYFSKVDEIVTWYLWLINLTHQLRLVQINNLQDHSCASIWLQSHLQQLFFELSSFLWLYLWKIKPPESDFQLL